ncbi:MAG TPA: MMPL family transporter [Polyangia bacterium]
MRALARAICRHPRAVLGAALALSVASGLLVRGLRLDTDVVDLLPRSSGAAAAFGRFAHAFGTEQTLIVLAQGDDPAALRRFADGYAAALAGSPLVRAVRHRVDASALELLRRHLAVLLDERDYAELRARVTPAALDDRAHRLRGIAQGPAGRLALERLTRDPLELLPLLARRLAAGRSADPQSGYFASADGHALLLFVTPARPPSDLAFDARLEAEARRLAAAQPGGAAVRLGLTGAPSYHLAYSSLLRGDLERSTIFSFVGVLLLFAVFYRVVRILPLVTVILGAGTLWTLAAAALLFHRIGAISLAFAAILLGIGIDVPIQIYNRLREELGHRPPREAVQATLEDLLGPAVLAAIGPAAVFAACGLSRFRGLAELGVLAAVGLALNLVASVALLPALLLVLPARLWTGRPRPPPRARLLAPLGELAARRPWALVAAALALTAGLAPFALRLRLEPHLLQSPAVLAPAQTERAIDELFAGPGGGARRLIALAEGRDLEAALAANDGWARAASRLRDSGAAAGYDSLATLVPSRRTQDERLALLAALDPPAVARELAAALERVGLRPEPFALGLAPLTAPARISLDDVRRSALAFALAAHLREHAGRTLAATYVYPARGDHGALGATLEAAAAGVRAAAPGAEATVTGGTVLDGALHRGLTADLATITGVSLALVLLLLAAYYRRARPTAVVMLSLAGAWVVFGGALALCRVPLNLFDLLAVPFVLGYGIDDHVFLVHRSLAAPTAPTRGALVSTGRAIALSSLATAAGFGGLLLARLEGLQQLGAAGTIAVLACLWAALGVAPALVTLLLARTAPRGAGEASKAPSGPGTPGS